MERATIRDVAQMAGFSITTVSMVLNDKPISVSDSTRQKIWEAARALHYRPNQLAVGMVTKHSNVLGLIIPDNSNLFFAHLSKAVEETARRAGYALIYGNTSNKPDRDYDYLRMFVDRQVDGIIYTKTGHQTGANLERSITFAQNINLPLITLDRLVPGDNIRAVVLNDFGGGRMATRHLLELGHRRIGVLTGPLDISSSASRLEGYRAALADAGVPFDETLIFEGTYEIGNETMAIEQFLRAGATAVFCFNDIMAMGIYAEAKRQGISIPGQLSIVGFDNIPFVEFLHPALTTVAQPIEEMGACAANLLVDLIENKDEKPTRRTYMFEPELRLRESTAPPAARG